MRAASMIEIPPSFTVGGINAANATASTGPVCYWRPNASWRQFNFAIAGSMQMAIRIFAGALGPSPEIFFVAALAMPVRAAARICIFLQALFEMRHDHLHPLIGAPPAPWVSIRKRPLRSSSLPLARQFIASRAKAALSWIESKRLSSAIHEAILSAIWF
jgi:hypothetical protein